MRPKRPSKPHFPIKSILLIGLTLFFFLSGAVLLWASTLEIPDLKSIETRKVEQSTKIYDRTGKVLLFDLHDNAQRTIVPIEEISRQVKNATVAIEDAEFYQHGGIKISSIIRAVLVNLGSFGYEQGGSTITQQVVKNSLLTTDKTVARKIKEWVLAIKLDQTLPKEKILELYLNESPYGGAVYGIEEAAQTFFGKTSSEVSLAEAAYLAAVPQAPTYFSPYGNHRDALEERKNLVLSRMRDLEFITDEEYQEAKKEKVVFAPPKDSSIIAPHFVFFVREYLENKYGKRSIEEDGYRVITTLDATLQSYAEGVVNQYALDNQEKFNAENAALVAIDPRTGEILTMVGSRNYFDKDIDGNFNVALAKRQPGSSFKPFVYAAALEKGYTPETVVFDLKTQFSTACRYDSLNEENPCYSPNNYDGVFHGPMTLRNALAQSVNVPAIKVLYLVGIDNAIRLARDMGISTLTNAAQYGLTLVLGGGEVTLLDMTSAYATFANNGERIPPTPILRIEDRAGNIIEEAPHRASRILPEQVALQISDMLADNDARAPAFGQTSALNFPGKDVAVKTGTTNDYRDAWILGYTPNIAVGAWAGNNDNSPMEKKVAGFIVAPLWNAFMQKAMAIRDVEYFQKPDATPTEGVPPILRGHWQGGESYIIDSISGKLATEHTPQETKQEKIVNDVHSILYWVSKNNPRGGTPTNPDSDPQFTYWEYPVSLWKQSQGIIEGDRSWIPTAYDDVHTPEKAPQVTIQSPQPASVFSVNQSVPVSIHATGSYALTKADLFINGVLVSSSTQFPFSFSFTPNDMGVTPGTGTISIVVYDAIFNRTEARTTVSFTE